MATRVLVFANVLLWSMAATLFVVTYLNGVGWHV